jgi:hypothetical protein
MMKIVLDPILNFLPTIQIVDELPGWIIASDKAAYNPNSNTIWIRHDQFYHIVHEFAHWFACKARINWIHKVVDGGKANYK